MHTWRHGIQADTSPSTAAAGGRSGHGRVRGTRQAGTLVTWAEHYRSFERKKSIVKQTEVLIRVPHSNSWSPAVWHQLHESKLQFASHIKIFRSQLTQFYAHVTGVRAAATLARLRLHCIQEPPDRPTDRRGGRRRRGTGLIQLWPDRRALVTWSPDEWIRLPSRRGDPSDPRQTLSLTGTLLYGGSSLLALGMSTLRGRAVP